ncbi:MAG TPA: type II toxin-antitoxin system prevent-host-death family antitoxin [Rhizomicrobium sp.]|nr:type II toxin-antitoxin system prevent-host-death family antitoxin [Rhizomicrobium sp.]
MVHILSMRVTVTAAKGQLTELVRRAEAGEEVVLTRHGQAAVMLTPVTKKPTAEEKAAVLAVVRKRIAKMKKSPGPSAARSQDFLYDKYGLPK